MADLSGISEDSRHKLPPISPRAKPLGTGENGKKPAKKKKKTVSENTAQEGEITGTASGKRRRKNITTDAESSEAVLDKTGSADEATVNPKRRKPEAPLSSEAEETPRPTKTTKKRKTPRKQGVNGSKTSLLSKDEEGELTTQTRVKKKKKKRVVKADDGGDFTDSGLAAELTSIEDDVVDLTDTLTPGESVQSPNTMITMKSQATNKIFVETDTGFKGQNKAKVAKRLAEEKQNRPSEIEDTGATTSIEFALKTHRFLQSIFLFCHGLTAGIALWHIVIVYILSYHPTTDFLNHYQPLALPVQCMFYILLVFCTISAFDRHDISYPTKQFIRQALTLQSGAVSVVIYLIALIISLVLIAGADRINLYYDYPNLWEDSQVSGSELYVFRSLNTVRGVFTILGWIVLSLTPNTDRLSENLNSKEDLLGNSVEMLSVSNA